MAPNVSPVAAAYRLTAAEAAVVADLARGLGVRDIAARNRIGRDTVYLHIKRALAKTCTRNQAQLVSLALGGYTPADESRE